MNKLSSERRERVVAALVEGNSIRATVRMTGVAKNTVTKLLVELGRACAAFQAEALVNLKSRRIQCDEIWSFVFAKERNADPERGHSICDKHFLHARLESSPRLAYISFRKATLFPERCG